MSRTVVNEPSGTVSPLALRTRILSTSLASSRYAAVGLRDHPEGAAEQVEVVDVGRAEIDLQRGEHVGHVDAEHLRLGAVDVEIELRRRGLEQREHLRRRPASAPRAPIMALTASCSACGPRPARSSTIMRKPPALPMPCTGGGATTKISASWIAASRLNSSPVMAPADLRGSSARLCERLEHHEDRAGIRRIGEGRAGKADDVDRGRNAGNLPARYRRRAG